MLANSWAKVLKGVKIPTLLFLSAGPDPCKNRIKGVELLLEWGEVKIPGSVAPFTLISNATSWYLSDFSINFFFLHFLLHAELRKIHRFDYYRLKLIYNQFPPHHILRDNKQPERFVHLQILQFHKHHEVF